MAEPLSLAAGIAGLVSLTIQVLQIANKFKEDVKGVREEVKALVEELTALSNLLKQLKTSWENKKLPPNFDMSALSTIEAACESQLKELLDKLTKAARRLQKKPYASIQGAMARIKWPFEADKTRQVTDYIHRYFNIFSWALHHRGIELLQKASDDAYKTLQDQEDTMEKVKLMFHGMGDVCRHIDAGIRITNDVLRVIELRTANLDEICLEVQKLNSANVKISKTLDKITSDVEDIKRDNNSKKTLNQVEKRLELMGKEQVVLHKNWALEIRKIIENGNEEQKTSMLPSTPYLQRHRQVYSSHEPGTGQWFLSHKRFRTWKDGNSPSTLLCTGPPGAGKSVLASLAVENVSKNMTNDDVQVAYLFCQYQHQISETAAILLSSILRQLLTPERVIFPFVRDKWLEIFNSPSTTAKLSNQLVPLIRILSAKSKRTYIIIDAIDEILETGPRGEDVRDDFLRSMIGLSSDCRILFTSRTHIDWDYYPAPSTRSILEIRAKDEDIIAYCTSAINASKSLSQYCKRLPTLRDNIIRTVVLKASGIFLLASRHIRRLASAISIRDIQDMLKTLSTNLPDVWSFCLERLKCRHPNKQALARRALSWVSCVRRPLTDIELAQALSYRPEDADIDSLGSIDVSMIIEVCDGMLHLETPYSNRDSARSVVTFTHASAADYITERLAGIDAELDIANTSLGYLSMDCLLEPDTRSPKQAPYYFLDYAMSFWSAHAAKAHDSVQLDNLLAFAKKSPSALAETAKWNLKDALHHLLEAGVSPNEVYCESSPLAIAASHGHLLCASYLVEAGAHVDYAGSERRPVDTALTLAVLSEYSQIIVLLIDSNADLNAGPVPPLIATIFNGNLDIAKQLLAAGCDPDVRYNGRSAIIVALDQNRMDIAEALMSGGADLNAFHGIGGETPLSTAIGYRRWEFALKLIERGSGLTDGTCLIQSMKHAASEGSEEVVRALLKLVDLDESSPTNEIGKDDIASMPAAAVAQICKKPLHHALEARKHGIAELLIDARSGINQVCGVPPYTALEWAAGRDDVALVKKLLFAGADPNLGGQVMPLMSAASRFVSANNCSDTKSTRIIALLLDAGADPHARGGKALSSLTVRVRENIRFGWWSKDDATVQRLLITLQLPEDWFVT